MATRAKRIRPSFILVLAASLLLALGMVIFEGLQRRERQIGRDYCHSITQEVLKTVDDGQTARELLDSMAVIAENDTAFGDGCGKGIAESRRFVYY